jgi:general secretion pathway protein N
LWRASAILLMLTSAPAAPLPNNGHKPAAITLSQADETLTLQPAISLVPRVLDKVAQSTAVPALPRDALLINSLAGWPLERLTATRERPLFSPSRRPAATPPAARSLPATRPPVQAPTISPPDVVLFGTVRHGEEMRAIIKMPGDRIVRLKPGDDIEGWKVSEIDKRRVVLSSGPRSIEVSLNRKDADNAAAAGAAADELAARQPRTIGRTRPPPK